MSIYREIVDWQTEELKAGRNPTEIYLTENQRRRLKKWCESFVVVLKAPDGTPRYSDPLRYSPNMKILGMTVKPAEEKLIHEPR